MNNAITGIVHGRTIQLDQEPGLPDGQAVSVVIEPAGCVSPPDHPEGWEGVDRIFDRLSAGGRVFTDSVESLRGDRER